MLNRISLYSKVYMLPYGQYVSVCEKQAMDSLAAMNSCGIGD